MPKVEKKSTRHTLQLNGWNVYLKKRSIETYHMTNNFIDMDEFKAYIEQHALFDTKQKRRHKTTVKNDQFYKDPDTNEQVRVVSGDGFRKMVKLEWKSMDGDKKGKYKTIADNLSFHFKNKPTLDSTTASIMDEKVEEIKKILLGAKRELNNRLDQLDRLDRLDGLKSMDEWCNTTIETLTREKKDALDEVATLKQEKADWARTKQDLEKANKDVAKLKQEKKDLETEMIQLRANAINSSSIGFPSRCPSSIGFSSGSPS